LGVKGAKRSVKMFWKGLLDNKILLITGYNENSEQAEVLDLVAKESTVLPSTFSFPEKIYAATGGVIHGIPFIIGGINRDSGKRSKECWKLTSEGWQTFAQLKTARSSAASVVLQDNQIWVTGGNDDSKSKSKSTEIINMKTGECKDGPDLPTKLIAHSMAKLDENRTLIIGGKNDEIKKSTLIFNQHSSLFTDGPEMNDARMGFGWGIFSSSLHNDRKCLLVAGGKPSTSSVEILDFTQPNATWKKISNLPFKMYGLSIVPTRDKTSVLAIALSSTFTGENDIYKLIVENGNFTWKKVPFKTKINRNWSVAL